ncbi:MAG: DUF1858 domain-containing protein [Isosphaeraceae bacterium]|nr:DUF1858 domain-containing protein [Isosphaeraceae bacterium]
MTISIAAGKVPLSPDVLVPDLLREHPEMRAVLDRHGLRGCGGRLGPYESLRFFARAHGVDEASLLAELEEAIAEPAPVRAEEAPEIADTIYRRYFLGAIALALTAGATWGAWLLWTIGWRGSFQGVSIQQVNAHGEAQVFGWVGLFIMGFAYQAFPRFWQTALAAPRLAAWTFAMMVTGLVLRTVGMASAGAWSLALPLALAGGTLQVVAILTFAGQIVATFVRSRARLDPAVGFILAALGWFAASSLFSLWHTGNTMTARTADELIGFVATYQAPLRDLQIHGLALFMILGVALRMLPVLFDLPCPAERRSWGALGLLSGGVLGEVALFLAYRWTGNHAFAALLMIPWGLLAAGALMVVLPWRPWWPFPTSDRSAKFIRAAFGWLTVSLTMLLLLPAYLRLAGVPFSHAYYGAIRHAITVGFVSMMILGMAARVVPTLNGVDPSTLSALGGPFLLVNLGCFLRVSTQTLTDWYPGAFAWIGVSGTLEVAGLAWWGLGLARLMLRGDINGPPTARERAGCPDRIGAHQSVADVLDLYPEALPVFVRHGFSALQQPRLRRTLARRVTIAQAAALRGVRADVLLDDLNASLAGRRPSIESSPTIASFPRS